MEEDICIERPEGRFGLSEGHFYIDCSCGVFTGSHLDIEGLEDAMNTYFPSRSGERKKHTFYMSNYTFTDKISIAEDEERPLGIICNNCGTRFPFTLESFRALRREIESKNQVVD